MTRPTLGARIRESREAQGLGIRQLARLIEVAPSQVLRYESDAITPSPPTLIALAGQLELPVRELFELAGRPLPQEPSSLPAMLRADYDLPPEAVAEVEAHIAAVAARYRRRAKRTSKRSLSEGRER